MTLIELVDWYNSLEIQNRVETLNAESKTVNLDWMGRETKAKYGEILTGNVMDLFPHDGTDEATYLFYAEVSNASLELKLKSLFETLDLIKGNE